MRPHLLQAAIHISVLAVAWVLTIGFAAIVSGAPLTHWRWLVRP